MATQTRYATADEAATGTWTVTPTSPATHYDKIDEQGTPDDADFITGTGLTGGRARSTYTFTAFTVPTGSSSISVAVRRRSQAAGNGSEIHASAIKVGGTYYDSAGANLGTTWTDADDTWATNPKSALDWTVDDVNGVGANALQAFGASSSDVTPNVRWSQVYISVTYTLPATTLTPDPAGVPAAVPATTLALSLTLTPGEQTIPGVVPAPILQLTNLLTVAALAIAIVLPAPTVSQGGAGTTLTPAPVGVPTVVGAPSLAMGAIAMTPAAVATPALVLAPALVLGGLTLQPSPLAASPVVAAPTLALALALAPAALATPAGLPAATVVLGGLTLSAAPVALLGQVPAPTLVLGGVTLLLPAPIALPAWVPAPSVVLNGGIIMTSLSDFTLAQLQAATVAQIRDAMSVHIAQMTKEELIRLDMYVGSFDQDTGITLFDDRVKTYREDQQMASQLDVRRDELGTQVSSTLVEWTYYETEPGRPVDTITIKERDATDQVVSQRTIKHYLDGRQPVEVA